LIGRPRSDTLRSLGEGSPV